MQLQCRSCDSPIPAENVNLEKMVAKCDHCHAVFNFSDDVTGHAKPKARRPAAMPKNMTVEEGPHSVTLTRRWLTPATFFLLFFCIFWDGFLVVWYSLAFSGATQNSSGSGFEWVMVLFPLGHVAVGVALTYTMLTGFLNTTKICVDERTLSVKHGPLPWPGNQELPTLDITQVFCQKSNVQKNNKFTYKLKLVMKGGKEIKLLSGLDKRSHALFIEQKIEEILGLQDQPVLGEVPR